MRCEGWLRSAEKPWSRCSSSSFAMEHGPWLSELEQMRWQDPSCTCVLRCTNDNGCRPINHPICNGTQRWLLGEWVSGFPRGSGECREPMILCAFLMLCWVYNSVSLYLITQMNTWSATWLYMKISSSGQRGISRAVLGCGSTPLTPWWRPEPRQCQGGPQLGWGCEAPSPVHKSRVSASGFKESSCLALGERCSATGGKLVILLLPPPSACFPWKRKPTRATSTRRYSCTLLLNNSSLLCFV